MAVFPFTVRATDSEGSYADRQFSITVRNSRVERFMLINGSDAFTSPDGTSWTQRLNQGGTTCAYGNGFWLILQFNSSAFNNNSNYGWNVRKSTDGINYSFVSGSSLILQKADGTVINQSAFPGLVVNTSPVQKVKFWNGKFYLVTFGNHQTTSTTTASQMMLWSSVDGITWTETILATSTATTTSLNNVNSASNLVYYQFSEGDGALFITNPISGNVAPGLPLAWMTTDGTTLTPIKNGALTASTLQYSLCMTRINGLYICQYNTMSTNGSLYFYSTDGLNWSSGSFPGFTSGTISPGAVFYMNGVVYSFQGVSTTNVAWNYFSSTDALTWNSGTIQAFNSAASNVFPVVLAKNGLIIVSATNLSSGTATSPNSTPANGVRVSTDGSTFTTITLPSLPTSILDCAAM